MIEIISQLLAVLTIIAQLGLLLGFFALITSKWLVSRAIIAWLDKEALVLAVLVAMTATLGSLFYSEVAGYLPCTLCWYQRIAMYPLVVTLLAAVMRSEQAVLDSSLALATIGSVISAYHNYIYFAASPLGVCSVDGQGVSCLARYVTEFNFVTIPLMAFTAFVIVAVLLLRRRLAQADRPGPSL